MGILLTTKLVNAKTLVELINGYSILWKLVKLVMTFPKKTIALITVAYLLFQCYLLWKGDLSPLATTVNVFALLALTAWLTPVNKVLVISTARAYFPIGILLPNLLRNGISLDGGILLWGAFLISLLKVFKFFPRTRKFWDAHISWDLGKTVVGMTLLLAFAALYKSFSLQRGIGCLCASLSVLYTFNLKEQLLGRNIVKGFADTFIVQQIKEMLNQPEDYFEKSGKLFEKFFEKVKSLNEESSLTLAKIYEEISSPEGNSLAIILHISGWKYEDGFISDSKSFFNRLFYHNFVLKSILTTYFGVVIYFSKLSDLTAPLLVLIAMFVWFDSYYCMMTNLRKHFDECVESIKSIREKLECAGEFASNASVIFGCASGLLSSLTSYSPKSKMLGFFDNACEKVGNTARDFDQRIKMLRNFYLFR